MIYSLFKSFFNSIGRTLGRIFVYILIAVLLIFFSSYINIADVHASEVESFNSRITLGRFQNGENVQIGQNESRTNTLSMYCSTCGTSVYYPLWIGFYGNKSGNFTSDKIYNFSLTINYPVVSEYYLFDWQRALRDATVMSSFPGAEIDYCTLEENSKTRTTTTCQFTASSGSYYEFNYYFGNLTNIGYDIYGSFGSFEPGDITLELLLTSTTDYGGQLVEQNEVIIGQNQQIIQNGFETNDKLEDINDTNKGIWQSIKELPDKFMEMLKGLFIPEDGYFEDWFNDLKTFFEEKLGFLATPFTIFIDFINRFLNINVSNDIIINIPDISVPNFEEYNIISATSLNWSQLLRSKDSLNTLWQLYLSFIDVILIVKFINLCENKYNQIFGGDVTNDN